MSRLRLKRTNSDDVSYLRRNSEHESDRSSGGFFTKISLKNENETSHTKETISKYFTENIEHVGNLNESDDFVTVNVPKSVIREVSHNKGKKVKKIAAKKSRSDLENYTKDFNKMCSANGVDVDPDHIQMAIAMSQSLQEYECGNNETDHNPEGVDKVTKMKRTLEAFGFTANSSIKSENSIMNGRKSRTYRKTCPLITKSDEEKKQIVVDKISSILLENDIDDRVKSSTYVCVSDMIRKAICEKTCCLYKSSLCYEDMEDDIKLFYVNDLVVPGLNKIGCLLKDWSNIPGREKSPPRKVEDFDMESDAFSKHRNLLLSETIEKIRNVVKKSSHNTSSEIDDLLKPTIPSNDLFSKTDNRCCSPDLFDDSLCYENEKEGKGSPESVSKESNEELPNVYLSQVSRSCSSKENINDVVLIEDEVTVEREIDISPKKSILKDSICDDNDNDNDKNEEINFHNDSKEEISIMDNGIVYYESYNVSFNESLLSPKSVNPEHCLIISENEQKNVDEVDLTQSDDQDESDEKSSTIKNLSNNADESNLNNCNLSKNVENEDILEVSDEESNDSVPPPLRECRTSEKFMEFIYLTNDVNLNDITSPSHLKLVNRSPPVYDVNYDLNSLDVETDYINKPTPSNMSCDIVDLENSDVNISKSPLYRSTSITIKRKTNEIETEIDNYNCTASSLPDVHLIGISRKINENKVSEKIQNVERSSELSQNLDISNQTEFIIKTRDVTPPPDYNSMNDSLIKKELSKYGIKPLKRKRAIQILEHIYEQTHPVVDITKLSILRNRSKRRKLNESLSISCLNTPNERADEIKSFIIGEKHPDPKQNQSPHKTEKTVIARNIDCKPEEWFFQTKEKSKIHGCRVPLHIAFYNFISTRPVLKEAILRYEPIDAECIHHGLIDAGFRYKIKDILDYLDKRCISVKNTSRTDGKK